MQKEAVLKMTTQILALARRWVTYHARSVVRGIFVPENSRRVATAARHRQLDRLITGLERRSARR